MSSTMAVDPRFKLLPFSWPDDLEPYLELHARAFASSPFESYLGKSEDPAAALQALNEYRRKRLKQRLSGADGTAAQYFKIVLDDPDTPDDVTPMVACAGWQVPGPASYASPNGPASTPTPSSANDPSGPQEVFELLQGIDGWLTQLTQRSCTNWHPDGSLPYWSLKILCTLPEYQRQGLGSFLLRHGLALARQDAQRRPDRVQGACCIGRSGGLRTYLEAGMAEHGSDYYDYGLGCGERYTWLRIEFGEDDARERANTSTGDG